MYLCEGVHARAPARKCTLIGTHIYLQVCSGDGGKEREHARNLQWNEESCQNRGFTEFWNAVTLGVSPDSRISDVTTF